MNNKLVPALIGGAIIGVLSSIPIVNYCCCIWAIGGGVLAVMLYVKNSQTPVPIGEGAMVGAMAGAVGGAIYFVLTSVIYGLIIGVAAFESQFRQTGVNMPLGGMGLIIVGALIGALFLVGLATAGGALGIPLFEKRKDGGVPPPPPTYGGDQNVGGGGYGGGSSYGAGPQ